MKKLLIAFAALAAGRAAPPPRITVLVWDYCKLPQTVLQQMASDMRALFSGAGLEVAWHVCRGAGMADAPAACDSGLGQGTYAVRLAARYAGQIPPAKRLGSAVTGGFYATLYAAEIREAARIHCLPFARLMAYTAAHEIGHLLAGPRHFNTGIMRTLWDDAAYRFIASGSGFSAEECAAMSRAARGNAGPETSAPRKISPPASEQPGPPGSASVPATRAPSYFRRRLPGSSRAR